MCGFNQKIIKKYIQNFFGERDSEKADSVQRLIDQSCELGIMARVPIFLFVICSVYDEDLITYAINTNTELYIYTTLVFLRNHMRNCNEPKYYDCLMSAVEDSNVMNVLYSVMELSVKTYI